MIVFGLANDLRQLIQHYCLLLNPFTGKTPTGQS
jgi:hypothetical protein